jgi:hypothetical protein
MNSKCLVTLVVCFFVSFGFAQNSTYKISGKVVSADEQTPLESATIYLETLKDSTLISYTISDKNGVFLLEGKSVFKQCNLTVSYLGYEPFVTTIDLEKGGADLQTIAMKAANELDAVLIKSRAPVTIKKDTLEFNVSSFKTKQDATVEDLLKELPGVEVDEEGNISINGKPVSEILVNGKPFFGDDATIATRNLTKEIIEKVQIVDTKSQAEAYAGEDGDQTSKTINLTISEENNKGHFGRLAAGYGTDDRYEFAGLYNYFNNDRRISVLAGGNNINSPGFSFGEIQKMFGNASFMSVSSNGSFNIDGRNFGGGDGIVTSSNIGANYADVISKGVDVSADYFNSNSNSENETVTSRETILPDDRFFSNSRSSDLTDNQNHSVNARLDIKIDSTLLLNIRPAFSYGQSQTSSLSAAESFNSNNELINTSSAENFSDNQRRNFSNRVDLTKRLGNKGSSLRFGFNTAFNTADDEIFLQSEALFQDANQEDVIRNQFTQRDETFNDLGVNVTFRQALIAKKLFLSLAYEYTNNRRENQNSTFDFNEISQDYDVFNTDLSSDFTNTNTVSKPSIGLQYRVDKFSANFNIGYVNRTLGNSDQLRPDLSLNRRFDAIEMNSYVNYNLSESAYVYVNYRLSNRPPSINQLQPFQNVNNPLNIITGNPELDPTNSHDLSFSYTNYDWQNGSGFYSYLNFSTQTDDIVTKSVIDENLVRTTTYENVNGNYNVYGDVSWSKKATLDSLRTIKFNLGAFTTFRNAVNFNNEVKYNSTNLTVSPRVGFTFNWKDIFELRPNYSLNLTENKFDLEAIDNQSFVSHTLRLATATFLPKKFEWRNDIAFNYNPNVAEGFQRSAWFWNSTVAYNFMKDKAILTLKIYDLLNQNTNARRVANGDFIQDTESTVLRQYFMLSFSWKFNTLGKKGDTSGGEFIFYD